MIHFAHVIKIIRKKTARNVRSLKERNLVYLEAFSSVAIIQKIMNIV